MKWVKQGSNKYSLSSNFIYPVASTRSIESFFQAVNIVISKDRSFIGLSFSRTVTRDSASANFCFTKCSVKLKEL